MTRGRSPAASPPGMRSAAPRCRSTPPPTRTRHENGGRCPASSMRKLPARSGTRLTGQVFRVRRPILQDIAGLTIERRADAIERIEADALHLARFQQRYVLLGDADALGEFLRAHLAARQHDVEIDDDRHAAP